MKKIDYTSVDGSLLRTFLVVLEEHSATAAAAKLGVTQSTVSHALAKLRQFTGDPLFVRSGQALLPTEVALSLKEPVQSILDDLRGLTHRRDFNPASEDMRFVIGANDMQRDLVFPQLLRELQSERLSTEFEFIPSGHPTLALLRDNRCQLAITPFPPAGSDIVQTPLFSGKMMCFYDGAMREPPRTWEEYCAADHLIVRFPDGGTSLRALAGVDKSKIRAASVSVPNFNDIPVFVRGTRLIVTVMDLMKIHTLRDLDMVPLPKPSDLVTIYMVWHKRSTNHPAHIWLRRKIEATAANIA
jgi:DNA-binding transcriptional LysR family regulator